MVPHRGILSFVLHFSVPLIPLRQDGLPDPQADLPGLLAIFQALWLAPQAFWLTFILSRWQGRMGRGAVERNYIQETFLVSFVEL